MCPLAPKQEEFAPRQANSIEFRAQLPPSTKPKYGSKPCSPKDIVFFSPVASDQKGERRRAEMRERASTAMAVDKSFS